MANPNMREIAAAAGFSKSTVSLALRNDPRLAASTRRKVQQVAAKLGYRRNAVVDHLMSQLRSAGTRKSRSRLGFVQASPEPRLAPGHPALQELEGARRRAWECGYELEEFWLGKPGAPPDRLVAALANRRIEGIILGAIDDPGQLLTRLGPALARRAVAAVGADATPYGLPSALPDHFQIGRTATRSAFAQGYHRPGLVLADELDRATDCRLSAGYLAAWNVQTEPPTPPFAFTPQAETKLLAWLRKHRPDVILTAHTEVRKWVEAHGWKVPGKLGLIHLERKPGRGAWAGMQPDRGLCGAYAADLVISQLLNHEVGPFAAARLVLARAPWIAGPTTR